jgi:hypothetical protein
VEEVVVVQGHPIFGDVDLNLVQRLDERKGTLRGLRVVKILSSGSKKRSGGRLIGRGRMMKR